MIHSGASALEVPGRLATLVLRPGGDPVVLVHGFTQNSRCWAGFPGALDNQGCRIVAVDLPGHGRSSEVRADLYGTARLLADTCGPGDYVGYSLGGRVLLHLALSRPDVVRRAVLVGVTAGIEDDEERAARVRADELLAEQLDEAGDDKLALGDFLGRWLAGPLFADLSEEAACITQRVANDAAGLASSLRLCGTGRQEPLWDRLSELSMPVLALAGENDDRFCSLARRIAGSIGHNATVEFIPGAGHACHLEMPVETARAIERFWSNA